MRTAALSRSLPALFQEQVIARARTQLLFNFFLSARVVCRAEITAGDCLNSEGREDPAVLAVKQRIKVAAINYSAEISVLLGGGGGVASLL